MTPSENRIEIVDGLRGVAVTLVLIWHFIGCLVLTDNNLGRAVYDITILGRTGVDLFFVLSGFLIIGILIDNKASSNLFRTFYVRRIARIFPAYFILIAIYWLAYFAIGPNYAFNANPSLLQQILAQLFFGFNFLLAFGDGTEISRAFQVTWSVALEEQYYLFIPVVIWLTPISRLRAVLIAIAIGSAALRSAFYMRHPDMILAAYTLPPFRLDCLCAGGLIATVWRNQREMEMLRRNLIWVRCVVFALLLMIPILALSNRTNLPKTMNLWGHLFLASFYASFLMLNLLSPIHALLARWLQGIARISYGVYLFHPSIISLIFIAADRQERFNAWLDVVLAAIALITTFGFAQLCFTYIEAPLRRAGHRARYKRDDTAEDSRNRNVHSVHTV